MQAFWHRIPIPDLTFPTEFRSKQIHNFPSFSRFEFSFYKFLTRTCILHSKFMCYNHIMQHNNSVYSLVWRWNCWAISDIKKILLICWLSEVQVNIFKSQIFSLVDFYAILSKTQINVICDWIHASSSILCLENFILVPLNIFKCTNIEYFQQLVSRCWADSLREI